MTNDSSKKPLYHIVDEEAKAGQCRIIEDALKNVGGEIEVAETVIKNQLNTTDSGCRCSDRLTQNSSMEMTQNSPRL